MRHLTTLILLLALCLGAAAQKPIRHPSTMTANPSKPTKPSKPAKRTGSPAASQRISTPKAVDLGLSVRWASFNLGASKPEGYGYYYKWGETKPADARGWATYKYAKGNDHSFTKYCTGSQYGYNGFTDGKTQLEPKDDAAAVSLGGSWRMPTGEEIKELVDKCTREWTKVNGVKGIRVTGPNGNSIFFPAAGDRFYGTGKIVNAGDYGTYWSSSTGKNGKCLGFEFFGVVSWTSQYDSQRAEGFPIRPVLAE